MNPNDEPSDRGDDDRCDGGDDVDEPGADRDPGCDAASSPKPCAASCERGRPEAGTWRRARRAPTARGLHRDDRAEIERRDLAKLLATVGGLAAVGSLAAPLAGVAQVFQGGPAGAVYEEGVALVDGDGDRVEEDRLDVSEHLVVFPETDPTLPDAPTMLVRYEEEDYGEKTNMEFTVDGYAAYSIVCTHAGCIVEGWEDEIMVCPCHAGKYDPLDGAEVVGGPPPRNLPQLPITISADGYLVATGPFPAPIGPEGGG